MPAPGKRADLVGVRFGRLLVIAFDHRTARRRSMWRCRCDCEAEVVVDGGNLRSGNTSSCGCYRADVTGISSTTHANRQGNSTPEYESWAAMWARVRAKTGRRYRDYGARGITVCASWRFFGNFLVDMGPRPPGTSLDRIINDGNYEPSNCRWATASQQNSNKRRNHPELAGAAVEPAHQ